MPGRTFGPLSRRVGAVHLGLVGLVNLASAAGVLVLLTGNTTLILVSELTARAGGTFALRHVPALVALGKWVLPLACLGLLALGILQVAVARRAYRARRWRLSVLLCGAGLTNPLAVPVALVGLVLLAPSRAQFSVEVDRRRDAPASDPG